jgi:F-type H+-transporting ATPase subunit a
VGIESVFPQPVFEIGPVTITSTVLTTWIIILTLTLPAIILHRRLRVWEPDTWQLTVEFVVEYVENLIADTVGQTLPEAIPYLTTMITFIALANLFGLLPVLYAPTSDLNTTLALSLVSLGSVHYYGYRQRGLKAQLLSLFEPVAFMFPLNVIGQVSRVLSMSLRLFGNVIAAEIIAVTMFMLMPALAPLPLNLLGMITGLLQALVFTVLTIAFMADAMQLTTSTAEPTRTPEQKG